MLQFSGNFILFLQNIIILHFTMSMDAFTLSTTSGGRIIPIPPLPDGIEIGPEGPRPIIWKTCQARRRLYSEQKQKIYDQCPHRERKPDIVYFSCGCRFCPACAKEVNKTGRCLNEEFVAEPMCINPLSGEPQLCINCHNKVTVLYNTAH